MTTTQSLEFPILQMPYADSSGAFHPDAVWFLASITQDSLDQDAGLTWYGYESNSMLNQTLTAALTGTGTKFSPIGQKSYSLTMPQFAQFAAAPGAAGATLMSSEFTDAVQFAQATLDTPTGAVDSKGQPVMVSFFAAATVSSVSVTY